MTTPAPQIVPMSLRERVDAACAVAERNAVETDAAAEFPVAALDELRRQGLLGLLVPEGYGGLGGGVDELLAATNELGRVDLSVAMIFAMHCQQTAAVVDHAAQPLRDFLLPRLAEGLYLASVTTEVGKGGDLLSAQSQLTADDEWLVIDRVAPIVTGGAYADGFLVTARSPWARSEREVSLVYADRSQLRVETSGCWNPLGMRASHSVALRLEGRVPDWQVIGRHGGFRDIAVTGFAALAHLGWAAAWLGAASGAMSRVLTLLRSPKERGRVNLDSELLVSRLSQARQRLETVHALIRHTASLVVKTKENGEDLSRPRHQLLINTLKITASEETYRAVENLIDAVGLRHGYLKDSPTGLERVMRDLRSAALNFNNDRLHLADGRLALLDPEVGFA
ncbi:alkylation response protein AidB-like acyl-CoA dehydrogenase [Amycolatopsis bartoniae]|uniref:Acyl-CoA dehydrogenase n=1 Tax=Amycolatopsis bartoniae TaxID=941986 RepID=A0A8H9IQL9_9PSEU|nr:acyl-CoA dehydrogenase family protein [Amycolatopsis bartoniae]MBB2934278.1 alkylation response protein AidB-like acyl-CoA dehydrogenase [Amycolatopsis bartoniae]TVT08477.1 acyl-CoA dehydrogenase [Amycolatopsis bartoniae]GHF48554.1 acyl-CoA dehydrogenase [Amycolatopsis bartoniae]